MARVISSLRSNYLFMAAIDLTKLLLETQCRIYIYIYLSSLTLSLCQHSAWLAYYINRSVCGGVWLSGGSSRFKSPPSCTLIWIKANAKLTIYITST